MKRPLSSMENILYLRNKITPYNCFVSIHIKGTLSTDVFEQALEMTKKRHQYLFYYILENNNVAEFFYDAKASIPVREVYNAEENNWVDECNAELNIPFDLAKAPLARAVILRKKDGADIIIIFSHIICDAVSMVYFAYDLLKVIDHLYENQSIDFLDELPDIYPEVKYLPDISKQLHSYEKIEKTIAYNNISDNNYPIEKRSTNIITCWLNETQTEYIISQCKKRNITENSLIAAALIINMKNYIFNKYQINNNFMIKTGSSLNVRKYYLCDINNSQFGCWDRNGFIDFKVEEITNLWDCALIYDDRLKELIEKGKPFSIQKERVNDYSNYSMSDIIKKNENSTPFVGLINLGKFELNEYFNGKIKLEKLSVGGPLHLYCKNDLGFGIVDITYDNRLNLIFYYVKPTRTQIEAKIFAMDFLKLIFENNQDLLKEINL